MALLDPDEDTAFDEVAGVAFHLGTGVASHPAEPVVARPDFGAVMFGGVGVGEEGELEVGG
jgi:hypothetical protein